LGFGLGVLHRATQSCCMLLHAWMDFLEASIATATSFIIVAFVSKISSGSYIVKDVRFSFVPFNACFTFPYAVASSPITMISSSCSGPKHCWRIFCWSHIFSTSTYDYLCSKMVIFHSTGGRVFILSEDLCAFSYTSLNFSSTTFISGSSTRFTHFPHRFLHILPPTSWCWLMSSLLFTLVLPCPLMVFSAYCATIGPQLLCISLWWLCQYLRLALP